MPECKLKLYLNLIIFILYPNIQNFVIKVKVVEFVVLVFKLRNLAMSDIAIIDDEIF